MGWTFFYKPRGMSPCEALTKEFSSGSGKVIACSAKLNAVYMAYQTNAGHVIALISAIRYAPKDPLYNFGYKDMEESMGPYYYDCPKKILEMLTPVDIAYAGHLQAAESAARWRATCWENIKGRVTLSVGALVTFKSPIRFTDGQVFTAMVVESTRPLRFRSVEGGYGSYRIDRRALNGATVQRAL